MVLAYWQGAWCYVDRLSDKTKLKAAKSVAASDRLITPACQQQATEFEGQERCLVVLAYWQGAWCYVDRLSDKTKLKAAITTQAHCFQPRWPAPLRPSQLLVAVAQGPLWG